MRRQNSVNRTTSSVRRLPTVIDADAGTVPPELLVALNLPRALSSTRMPGYEAAVWRTELADGRTVAVRLLRAGMPADGELTALRLAAGHRRPVPTIVAHGRWTGREAIVTAWCPGRS